MRIPMDAVFPRELFTNDATANTKSPSTKICVELCALRISTAKGMCNTDTSPNMESTSANLQRRHLAQNNVIFNPTSVM